MEDQRLRDVYRSILGAEPTADAYSASEATQDFMARLRDIAATGVDRISIGKLTKDVRAVDLSMRVDSA